ncbi:uncharacterized protein BDZ99DRAFT_517751 [Mytilinidion resinicola]|uniref:Uncharacterized protein n=1 Tax=Mytilinidion resinicola TaxID=574789 RepID=A0A6A6YY74_9PEZI|nr:uncharacterized protein BDZ99DRAFT_517751 [Mytilinidion resinicola]KAF2813498.1 hypothetical protein BDZ99DRAFT_517751 [Mytilinidion resinicola]
MDPSPSSASPKPKLDITDNGTFLRFINLSTDIELQQDSMSLSEDEQAKIQAYMSERTADLDSPFWKELSSDPRFAVACNQKVANDTRISIVSNGGAISFKDGPGGMPFDPASNFANNPDMARALCEQMNAIPRGEFNYHFDGKGVSMRHKKYNPSNEKEKASTTESGIVKNGAESKSVDEKGSEKKSAEEKSVH